MNKVLVSKKSDNWETPKELYNIFIENGFYDPCPYLSKQDNLKNNMEETMFYKSTIF